LTPETTPEVDRTLRAVLIDVLGLSAERVAGFTDATGLFGALPELDSMAVAGLLTELEDRLGIHIDDDEVVRGQQGPRLRPAPPDRVSGCNPSRPVA
jgi:acyl carrier protein